MAFSKWNLTSHTPALSRALATASDTHGDLRDDQRPVRDLELRVGASLNGLEKGKSNLEADLAYLR
jgi:hypothetical protein